jgi:hypothetical protein
VPLRVRKEIQEMLRQGRLNKPSAVLAGCLPVISTPLL